MFAEVAIPVYVNQTFTYLVPLELQQKVQSGHRCLVSFSNRLLVGYIVNISPSLPEGLDEKDLKCLICLIDEQPLITTEILELTRWMADYYHAPWGEVLKAALPVGINTPVEVMLSATEAGQELLRSEKAKSSKKWQLLSKLNESGQISLRQLQKELSISHIMSTARVLEREGLVTIQQQLGQPVVNPKRQLMVRPTEGLSAQKLTEQQRRVVEALKSPLPHSTLLKQAGVSASVIRTMQKKGYLEVYECDTYRDPLAHLPSSPILDLSLCPLTAEQSSVLSAICSHLEKGEYATFLLYGVTGAGKTEVYLRAMRRAVELGRTAMMLVPEIALAPMFSRRLREHFGQTVAILHSSLSEGERLDEWQRLRNGQAKVVIGARSAIFAPIKDLGLIVVDEEHDPSYKQQETPRYNARDSAVIRALKSKAVAILGSATPSLESYYNAQSGKYGYLHLPTRIGGRPLAEVEIIDMRAVFKRHGKVQVISQELQTAVGETLARGEQAIILLNRRGYSSFLLCRSCGLAIKCRDCEVTLTYHRETAPRLVCHYCNFQRPVPTSCPQCSSRYLHYVGEGTEQLEAIFKDLFPTARIARLDRDSARRRGAYEQLISAFAAGEIDLMIGTQMVAKGHDFHNVTLVGVVSVDAGLGIPDFRAAERTFQLLTQVAGRAGRGNIPGKVLIQSYHPEHYALKYAAEQDYKSFYEHEIKFRRAMYYPPFSVLVNLIVRHKQLTEAQTIAAELYKQLRTAAQIEPTTRILGPAPAPIARLKGNYRIQIMIKARSRVRAKEVLELAIANSTTKALEAITIDVDPVDLI
ncbi:MAG: primosomal protein N' [Acidobacteriota bacterium]|nr:primosomal protein N' [Blastocatellia bacterium]MDW8412222.1 primosomal protein N' [Acidobacteriota bacterium]